MSSRLILFVLLLGAVNPQGFGEFDEDEEEEQQLPANGDRSIGGKKTQFDIPDDQVSPQQKLDSRLKSAGGDSFTEKLPVGKLKFGDTVLSDYQHARLFSDGMTVGQIAINDEKLRWPDAVVPYEIDCSLTNLNDAMAAIKAAMKEWESKTCIRFVERKKEKKYLRFFRDTHCWGHVGMHDYSSISVGYGCEKKNVMAHEIGHAIGFYHEHNRQDRDQHVKIHNDKIVQFKDAFEKVKSAYSFGVPYDYASIMHYPWNAFSRDGSDTMTPLKSTSKIPYKAIGYNDIQQVRIMYKCDEVEKKRRKFEQIARSSVPPRDPVPRPANADEWGIFFSSQSAPGDPGCVDWSKDCQDWAGAGFCQTQAVVRKYCKKTCNQPICSGNECVDRHPKCKSFGRFCKHYNYKAWMKENCCASCYKNSQPACRDTKSYCNDHSQYGYCTSSKMFRESHCCRTCKELANKKKSDETCKKDLNQNCRSMKAKNYCETRREYMERNCCKTCKEKPITKECAEDERTDCVSLKKSGHCVTHKEYMSKACCVTCRNVDQKVIKNCTADVYKDCDDLKKKGYCESRRALMKEKCCMTCKGTVCNKPEKSALVQPLNAQFPTFLGTGRLCSNVKDWNPEKCPRWAQSGWCQTKSKEMHLWCKKSCRFCDEDVLQLHGSCSKPLGLSYGGKNKIPDSAFTSALPHLILGSWSAGPENARLYFEDDYINKRVGGWCSKTSKSTLENLQFITVNLGSRKRITHIATQGRDKYFERISKFKIEYSNTGEDDDFCPYIESGVEKVFEGNCDHVTPVLNQFWTPIEAQYIKFIPWTYNYPCVRMELYGCEITETQPVP